MNAKYMFHPQVWLLACLCCFLFPSCNHSSDYSVSSVSTERFSGYRQHISLNKTYPYNQYVGKDLYLQRDARLYVRSFLQIKASANEINSWYLDGTATPDGYKGGYSFYDSCELPRGTKIRVCSVEASYHELISKENIKNGIYDLSGMGNGITAEVEITLPLASRKRWDISTPTIKAKYGWCLEGGMYDHRSVVTPFIRRAPWEPDSVPAKRYVGRLGNEILLSKEKK